MEKSDLFTSSVFGSYIGSAGRVVAYEHDCEAGLYSSGIEKLYVSFMDFIHGRIRDFFPCQYSHGNLLAAVNG
jgi:hypothetical protein